MRIVILYMLFSVTITIEAGAWSVPPDIVPTKVYLNHNTSSSSSDGLTIKNGSIAITAPEWTSQASKKAAYEKGISPTVNVEFYASSPDINTSITMVGYAAQGTATWDLGAETFYFESDGDSGVISFSLDSGEAIPATVGIWYTNMYWQVTAIGGSTYPNMHMGATRLDYYTVYDDIANYHSSLNEPRTDILDLACDWASGESAKMDCVSEVAEGLFGSGATYNSNSTESNDSGGIDISDVLNDFPNIDLDCRDFSNFYNVLLTSIGIKSYWCRIEPVSPDTGISSNYDVEMAGSPYGYGSQEFAFHQVSFVVDGSNNYVIDADLRFDDNGTPHIPQGDMTFSTYISKLTYDTVSYTVSTSNKTYLQ